MRGVLCNLLVCMAVWMAMAGRSVVDKAVAVLFPVSAFVAAGFEHSIANMYRCRWPGCCSKVWRCAGRAGRHLGCMLVNWMIVIAGNLLGGSVLVALTYHIIYRRGRSDD